MFHIQQQGRLVGLFLFLVLSVSVSISSNMDMTFLFSTSISSNMDMIFLVSASIIWIPYHPLPLAGQVSHILSCLLCIFLIEQGSTSISLHVSPMSLNFPLLSLSTLRCPLFVVHSSLSLIIICINSQFAYSIYLVHIHVKVISNSCIQYSGHPHCAMCILSTFPVLRAFSLSFRCPLSVGFYSLSHHSLCRFDTERARFYSAEIVCALKFLHQKGIVYRQAEPLRHLVLYSFVVLQGPEVGQPPAGLRGSHTHRRLWHVQAASLPRQDGRHLLWHTRLHGP